ncbi:MAG: hypothetical protein ACK4MV_08645 [Beijerinckiaceae bacterium]
MKKITLATAAAAALMTSAASWQPAEAQTRYVTRHHTYYSGGWGWNNPVAWGAGAIVGTAAAIATAPLWAVGAAPYYAYDYGYAPAYYPAYGYSYRYVDPVYAPAPVVYTTRVAPRRVVYRSRVVAPRRTIRHRVIRAERPIRAHRSAVRTVRY